MHVGKENGDGNNREAAPGDAVVLGGVILVQRRQEKVVGCAQRPLCCCFL